MSIILKKNRTLAFPGLLWFLVFFLLPLSVILIYSITERSLMSGEPIRTFAWKLILSDNGILNQVLLGLNIIDEPLRIMYTQTSVLLGLVYTYTPMMVLPLYAALLRIDDSLIEASLDLGASRARAFFDITFRLSLTGIFAGTLLVFIPALGSFAIPAILGGTDSVMIGNMIENQFNLVGNWNTGSAFTISLAVLSIVLVLFYSRIFGLESIYKNRGI